MADRVIIVNKDFIVCAESKYLIPNDDKFRYEASCMAFLKSKKEEIKGGILYADSPLTLSEAKGAVEAGIHNIIYPYNEETKEDITVVQFLISQGVEICRSANIIFWGDE